MAPLKVHGVAFSTCTMRVLSVLYEKDLSFELLLVDIQNGQHKSQHYLKALNPFGLIPALEDGELKLFESRAMTQYISHHYMKLGAQLVSQNTVEMAKIAVAMEVESQQFNPPAAALALELVFKPMMGMKTDTAAVKANEEKLAGVLDVYEERLTLTKYVAGDSFTLADLHHCPCLHYLLRTQAKALIEALPHVRAWCAELMARPSWVKVLALQQKDA